MSGLKPGHTAGTGFSATCEAVPFQNINESIQRFPRKALNKSILRANIPSGAKAHFDSARLMSGLKPGPTAGTGFSAACEAVPIQNINDHLCGGHNQVFDSMISRLLDLCFPTHSPEATPRTKTCPWGPRQANGWGTELVPIRAVKDLGNL